MFLFISNKVNMGIMWKFAASVTDHCLLSFVFTLNLNCNDPLTFNLEIFCILFSLWNPKFADIWMSDTKLINTIKLPLDMESFATKASLLVYIYICIYQLLTAHKTDVSNLQVALVCGIIISGAWYAFHAIVDGEWRHSCKPKFLFCVSLWFVLRGSWFSCSFRESRSVFYVLRFVFLFLLVVRGRLPVTGLVAGCGLLLWHLPGFFLAFSVRTWWLGV